MGEVRDRRTTEDVAAGRVTQGIDQYSKCSAVQAPTSSRGLRIVGVNASDPLDAPSIGLCRTH